MRNLIDDLTTWNSNGMKGFPSPAESLNAGAQDSAAWPWFGSADAYEAAAG